MPYCRRRYLCLLAVCAASAVALAACVRTVATRAPTSRPTTAPTTVPSTLPSVELDAAALRGIYSKLRESWPEPTVDAGVTFREIGRLPPPEFPPSNPYTKEREALGRQLFFDPRLSGSGQIACASCHDPDLAWADGRTVSFGHDRAALRRNAPSVLFAAYATPLFWDGRAASLEDQARTPVAAHDEMNANSDAVAARLNAIPEYRDQFARVYGAAQVTFDDVAKALATFQRALATGVGRSAFDKFMNGDSEALSDSAVRGLHLFRTKGRCLNCHGGPAFTDNDFHDLGLSYYGPDREDLGRYHVSGNPRDVGRFRTPSLRNVGRTAPYMHNGLFDLKGLINAYNAGMPTLRRKPGQENDPLFPTKDPLLKRLDLGPQERSDLQAFLESLNEPPRRIRPPALPGDRKDVPSTAPEAP